MANENGWGDGSVNNAIGWGQGANNAISWGKSHLDSWSGATDIDGGNAPINTVAPALSGTAQEGQTLTCSTGTWSGSPTYAYQWKRNGNNIGSATNSTYTLVTADVGQSIKCTVTATNFSGSANADSNTVTPTSSVDADAQAFITAASITDPTQQSAINNLVIGLKADSLWTKMKVIYPMVGGTNSQHTWNLRNTAQYQANWIGGVTHSNLGVKFNGMNGYGGTGLNFSTALASSNSNSIGYYSGTNLSETMPDPIAMGAYDNVANFALISKNNTSFFSRLNAASISHSTITMKGFFSASRQSSTLTDIYLNGSQVATGNSGGVLPNLACYLGNINIANAPYGSGYILNDMRFAYISDGLNDTEMTNLYNRVQTFQTTLGRQV